MNSAPIHAGPKDWQTKTSWIQHHDLFCQKPAKMKSAWIQYESSTNTCLTKRLEKDWKTKSPMWVSSVCHTHRQTQSVHIYSADKLKGLWAKLFIKQSNIYINPIPSNMHFLCSCHLTWSLVAYKPRNFSCTAARAMGWHAPCLAQCSLLKLDIHVVAQMPNSCCSPLKCGIEWSNMFHGISQFIIVVSEWFCHIKQFKNQNCTLIIRIAMSVSHEIRKASIK